MTKYQNKVAKYQNKEIVSICIYHVQIDLNKICLNQNKEKPLKDKWENIKIKWQKYQNKEKPLGLRCAARSAKCIVLQLTV